MSIESKKKLIENLKTVFSKQKNKRGPEECELAFDFFRKIPTVASLSDENILELCQCSSLQYVKDMDEVYTQDSPSDSFYIILVGSVKITKRLVAGILNRTPRTETATSEGNTYLVRVEMDDYCRLFKHQHQQELAQKQGFLSDVSVLRHMNPGEMKLLSEIMTEVTFPPNKVIIKEREEANSMYFIVSGKAEVVMTVIYKDKPHFIQITMLGANDFFGELGLLTAAPRAASIVAHTPLTCLILSAVDFGRLITGSTLQALKEYVKRYTPRNEIVHMFGEKQKWDNYKKKIVEDIIEKKRKRKGV